MLPGPHMRAAEAFRYDLFNKWTSIGMVQSTLRDPSPYDSAYAFLEDDTSRTLYDWFVHVRVAYATLGEQAFAVYPPPISREDYTKLILSLGQPTAGGFRSGKWIIDSMPGAIVDSILREQYRLPGVVEPQNGDTILDIGAYKGETAIWFADKAGSRGLVLALEPGLQTSVVLRQNVDRNHVGGMAPIRVLQYAIGARQGTARFISSADSGSALGVEGDAVVSMTTVDALVLEQGLGRVDFIKMDIEGGEVNALRGAEGTLRRFSPRLAISVYHRPDDLPDVAALVRQACPNYRLYLSHKSPGLAETVLFAVAASNPEISTTMQAAGD
jgi:FkbM family methyltransferase